MRIAYSFLIVLVSVFLFLLPITEMVYDFRTDLEDDTFTVTTAVGVTSANTTLLHAIYDNDTDTISYTSNITEVPAFSTYNSTTRQLLTTGLTANVTRLLVVYYDIDAITDSDAINTLLDRLPWLWILICAVFPMAGLAAIWTGRG
jgi:hypothetical protein